MRSLQRIHGDPVFDADPAPTVVLDAQFTIRASNKAHRAVTGRRKTSW